MANAQLAPISDFQPDPHCYWHAFEMSTSGVPAVWRADLNPGLVEQLTLPAADERDFGPTARTDSNGRFAFFRVIGAGKPHLYVGRLGETSSPWRPAEPTATSPGSCPRPNASCFIPDAMATMAFSRET